MRRAFAETLMKVATENPRVVFLTGDMGFQVFDEFEASFGPRYVNVGVAEAQLVCCAAGMAMEGWKPIIYSIGSFMTGRPFEQIRVTISYPKLPVIVVGAGGGYTYAASGVTHHAADDLALMSGLPNMTVVAPGDPSELAQLLPQLFELPGPSYIRIGRFGEPSYEAESPAVLGRSRLLRQGERVAIISTGDMALVALEAANMLDDEGIHPIIWQMHTVKPLDTTTLAALDKEIETMIIVEEHLPIGGLFSRVNDWYAGQRQAPKLVRLGAPDAFVLGSPTRQELHRRIGLDAESIAEACRVAWNGS